MNMKQSVNCLDVKVQKKANTLKNIADNAI